MAKRRKKSSKCPEPFNTLIDLAAAATLDYIAYKRRQKRGGKKNHKIDPYAVAGVAMGMGKLNSTEDIIKLGGFLGAMGAFDEDDDTSDYSTYSPSRFSSPKPYQASTHKPSNKNRYAWRMNCENGSAYGIYPESYETRDEYNAALKSAKGDEKQTIIAKTSYKSSKHKTTEMIDADYQICKISILNSGENEFFKIYDASIKVGDEVVVLLDNNSEVHGIVVATGVKSFPKSEEFPMTVKRIIKRNYN